VRYTLWERKALSTSQADAVLAPEALAALPEGLRRELAAALLYLDVARVTRPIRFASGSVGDVFTGILTALNASREGVGEEAV
jgi:hypothetical protein